MMPRTIVAQLMLIQNAYIRLWLDDSCNESYWIFHVNIFFGSPGVCTMMQSDGDQKSLGKQNQTGTDENFSEKFIFLYFLHKCEKM